MTIDQYCKDEKDQIFFLCEDEEYIEKKVLLAKRMIVDWKANLTRNQMILPFLYFVFSFLLIFKTVFQLE